MPKKVRVMVSGTPVAKASKARKGRKRATKRKSGLSLF